MIKIGIKIIFNIFFFVKDTATRPSIFEFLLKDRRQISYLILNEYEQIN